MRPLLCLVMIVKNEAAGITRTLESALPVIDRWCILDTGSSDGTQGVIRRVLAHVPGELHEEPFVDFATTRNRALDLAKGSAEWLLLLDADDILDGAYDLRIQLRQLPAECDGLGVRATKGSYSWLTTRLVRSGAGWSYVGTVHEVLIKEGSYPISTCEATIRHEPGTDSESKSRARWARDKSALEREVVARPGEPRPVFYLALTCHWLGHLGEAEDWFRRRIEMGGWHEEIFESFLRVGHCRKQRGAPVGEIVDAYLAAFEVSPHRAEPLVYAAAVLARAGRPSAAQVLADRAKSIPYPHGDLLFVDASVYAHGG